MKLHMVSLGCDKNRVDSEKLLYELLQKYEGSGLTDDPAEADIIIVNTCAFIGPAKEESINTILEMAEYKKTGLRKLIVAGCLAERYLSEIKKELPEVDEVIPVNAYRERLDKSLKRSFTGDYYSYLKIAEGCDKYCSYCIIPKLRGHYRSVAMEQLIGEARLLSQNGCRELILVAQETSLYGTDLYGKKALPELLDRLSEIEGIEWIRLMYCYPEEITPEIVEAIRRNKKVLHYLDIPIQHSSDRVLKAMNRKTREKELRERIAYIRQEIPDIVLRTTLITGFPGESEEDFLSLKQFVQDIGFERLGVFPYSREEGTKAADLPQLPEKIKKKRRDILMAIQQKIAFEKERSYIGRELRVIITGFDTEKKLFTARSYMDSPDIDSIVYIIPRGLSNKMAGDMLSVRITGSSGYDLIAEAQ